MSWYLDNVYELNKESPYTCYVPSLEVLEKVKVGDLVKLIFVTNMEEDYFEKILLSPFKRPNIVKVLSPMKSEKYRKDKN